MTRAEQQFELMRRLCAMADDLADSRTTTLAREAAGVLRDQVEAARGALLDDGDTRLIGYEAACLVEMMAELSYARQDQDRAREERALFYMRPLRLLMRGDYDIATRKAALQ